MKKLLDGADIVYQMAAEVEAEKSKDKSDAVWKVNYDGAMGISDICGPNTRLIFPSTGNVFGGVDESVKNYAITLYYSSVIKLQGDSLSGFNKGS